ncbi:MULTISPECIES: DUF2939 domain-containing protein [Thermus]|jgi:hypothetical protein|uniref:DUF2939 domain-containing protein n=1 Tax=Thermus brockianus TaxID=56956 RepID=A0A1J0LRU2_THEBO|nr:DUF2939 domain-containing protein [Thermus brockianus]APD09030.1 hypothetical protein A0O31_00856 [Thermus brockianus]
MRKPVWIALLGLVLIAAGLGAYLWASPYLFLRELQEAILAGDRARLERMVDFPRVREGLKAQINAQLLKELEKTQDPFAGLGYVFAAGLINAFVDAFLTPEGLAAIGTGAEPGQAPKEEVRNWRLKYQDFRTAYIHHPNDPQSRLYLERQGLFGWRVVRIDLPPE